MENSYLLDYIGKTKTENLMNEITKGYFELKEKTFPESTNPISNLALISVTQPNETEILSIGHSCVNDLIVENFLIWLKYMMSGSGNPTMKDITNTSQPMWFGALQSVWWGNPTGVAVGTSIQIGSGIVVPNFNDVQINTPFPASPENLVKGTTTGVYFVGLSQAKCSATYSPTTNGGAIGESAFIGSWRTQFNVQKHFMLTHDSISPVVNFSAGQAINIDYIFQI